jgi:hypothetical protein
MEKKVFRSRISVVLTGIILAVFILITAPLFYYLNIVVLIIIGITFLFYAAICTGMRYVIAGDKLYMKMWTVSISKVSIMDIVSVKRSYNPLSSPAASLKRLRLQFNEKSEWPHYSLVSPVREQEFLETLKSINPDIDIQAPEKQSKWRIWDWDI